MVSKSLPLPNGLNASTCLINGGYYLLSGVILEARAAFWAWSFLAPTTGQFIAALALFTSVMTKPQWGDVLKF